MKSKKMWLSSFFVLVFAVLMLIFWDTVIMHIAPKTVLSTAIADTIAKLETRFADCPLLTIAAGYDDLGQNTVHIRLDTADKQLRQIDYDMILQTDADSHQILADGTVTADSKVLDVSVYMNTDFVALTSHDLLQGGYYGITYDTFSSDIREFPLIDLLIPDTTITEWNASLQKLQSFMCRSYVLPQVPDITEEDVRMLMLGILALKSNVDKENVILDGVDLNCYKITYSETGSQVEELLRYILEVNEQDYAEITASFYLYEKSLVKIELIGISGQNRVIFDIVFGRNAADDDLSLSVKKTERGVDTTHSAVVSTKQEGGLYAEAIAWDSITVRYDWYPSSGKMKLYLPEQEPIVLYLSSIEQGLRIKTTDIMKLINIESESVYDCTMDITKGSNIAKPVYKNMDQWSFDDLVTLLSGVGHLFGLRIG